MAGTHIDIDLQGDALNILKQLQSQFISLNEKVDVLESNAKSSFSGIANSLKQISFVQITQGLENFKNTLSSVNEPGMAFESQLADLSAITGITGNDLDFLGDKAKENAEAFGGDAADSVEVYKLLLSQLSPELAKYPEILSGMADNVSVLSKTMGGDTSGAVEVLTTAMNQYGVSLDNPLAAQDELNRMMNAMAAGAKEGSAELPALKEAIENVGGDAQSSALEFEELVSAIEALDKAGKKGSEGGNALRNVLASLNQGRFLPKDVQDELRYAGINIADLTDKSLSFTDRLRALNPIANDTALLTKLFGKENKLAAEALLNTVDAQDQMTKAITGTNTAEEQANIIMGTRAESLSRIDAWYDNIKIAIYDATGAFGPFLEMGAGVLASLSTIAPAISLITQSVNWLTVAENRLLIVQKLRSLWTGKLGIATIALASLQGILSATTGSLTAVQWLLNVAMTANPIGLIIVAIGALVAAIVWLTDSWDEFLDFFVDLWDNLTAYFTDLVIWWAENLNPFSWLLDLIDSVFPGIKEDIVNFFSSLWDAIYSVFFKPFVDAWNYTMGWIFGDADLNGEVEHTVSTDGGEIASASGIGMSRTTGKSKTYSEYVFAGSPMVSTPNNSMRNNSQSKHGAGFASAEKKEINTKIEHLVKNLNINVPEVRMSVGQIRAMIEEALVGAVRDFEVAVD